MWVSSFSSRPTASSFSSRPLRKTNTILYSGVLAANSTLRPHGVPKREPSRRRHHDSSSTRRKARIEHFDLDAEVTVHEHGRERLE